MFVNVTSHHLRFFLSVTPRVSTRTGLYLQPFAWLPCASSGNTKLHPTLLIGINSAFDSLYTFVVNAIIVFVFITFNSMSDKTSCPSQLPFSTFIPPAFTLTTLGSVLPAISFKTVGSLTKRIRALPYLTSTDSLCFIKDTTC